MFLLQNTFIEVTTPFEIYCQVIATILTQSRQKTAKMIENDFES